MTPVTWLLIPFATGILASVWGCFAGRRRRRNIWRDVDRYDRLRAALSRGAS
ncbi:hypothetical protein [Streptomyces sp. NPDC046197]|uniref:hypothetical protein n=1 Tax=Streptomyces sp. NPDC046197 TaxID=3154337 RepID=UPI0033E7D4CC